MDNDYKMKVQGFVHLTNLSGKDITIDNYSLKIPYYLLKNTKVTLIDPKNFLIDTYTEKGSTLFTIKSPYSKPSIISKSRKIIFSFTAEIANPYTDFSGFREVDFPFSTPESENKTYIYFSFPKDLPLIYPSKNEITVGQTSGKYEIEITDTAPKSYIFFRDNSKIALKHVSRSGNLLLLGKSLFPCSKHEFVSCTDCGEGYLENENVSFVHPNGDILSHITQYTANKECYFNSEKVTNLPNFVLGYVINPTDRKVNLAILGKQISGTTEKFTYPNKREVPSPLIIPLST